MNHARAIETNTHSEVIWICECGQTNFEGTDDAEGAVRTQCSFCDEYYEIEYGPEND